MTAYTEGNYAGEYLASEATGPGYRSRELVTLVAGNNLSVGTVLGQITGSGSATSAAVAGNAGTGTIGAITVGAGAKVGIYTLTIVEPASNAGAFIVENPDGVIVGHGTVGVAFSAGGLAFTLADATDFAAGDQFTIAIAAGSGKFGALDLSSVTGLATAAAILYDNVDASAGDKVVVATLRDAIVKAANLVWPAGITSDEKSAALTQLAGFGILAR